MDRFVAFCAGVILGSGAGIDIVLWGMSYGGDTKMGLLFCAEALAIVVSAILWATMDLRQDHPKGPQSRSGGRQAESGGG